MLDRGMVCKLFYLKMENYWIFYQNILQKNRNSLILFQALFVFLVQSVSSPSYGRTTVAQPIVAQKPFFKRLWFLIPTGVVLLFLLFVILFLLIQGGEEKDIRSDKKEGEFTQFSPSHGEENDVEEEISIKSSVCGDGICETGEACVEDCGCDSENDCPEGYSCDASVCIPLSVEETNSPEESSTTNICDDADCGAYICESDSGCYSSCSDASACASGYACDTDSSSFTFSTCITACNEDDCGGYACLDTLTCGTSCSSTLECASGYVCDTSSSTCVAGINSETNCNDGIDDDLDTAVDCDDSDCSSDSACVEEVSIQRAFAPIYVSIFTHVEEPGKTSPNYLEDEDSFWKMHDAVKEFAEMLHEEGVAYNFQSDWNFLQAIAQYDSEGTEETNNKNLLLYLYEDLHVQIDPHGHETKYNLADVAYLIEQLGVQPSGLVGGFIVSPVSESKVDYFQEPLKGNIYDYTWEAEILWGGGTGLHQDEEAFWASGVWRPKSKEEFLVDKKGNLPNVGKYDTGWEGLQELLEKQKNGELNVDQIYTVSVPGKQQEIVIEGYKEEFQEYIQAFKQETEEGRIIWIELSEVIDVWKEEYNSEPNIYKYEESDEDVEDDRSKQRAVSKLKSKGAPEKEKNIFQRFLSWLFLLKRE